MAVRFDADTEELWLANSGLGSQGAVTACCWMQVNTNRSAYGGILEWSNGTGNTLTLEVTDSATTQIIGWTPTVQTAAITVNLNTWYFVAITKNSSTVTIYARAHNATSWSTQSIGGDATTRGCDDLYIGRTAFAGEWLNGTVASVKTWFATLTQAELEAEMWQYAPARTANLVAWYPLTQLELTDYSGNGRTLSDAGGSATADGPPIAWRSSRILHQVPSGGGGTVNAAAEDVAATATAYGATAATGSAAGHTSAAALAEAPTAAAEAAAGDIPVDVTITTDTFPLSVAAGHASAVATAYDPASTGWADATATAYGATVRVMQVGDVAAAATATQAASDVYAMADYALASVAMDDARGGVGPVAGPAEVAAFTSDPADPAGFATATATAYRASIVRNEVPPFRTYKVEPEYRVAYIFRF